MKYKKIKESEIETFIKEYKDFLISENIFNNYEEIEEFFTMGGCYIFARILQKQFNFPIAINNKKNHCGMYIRKSIFEKYFFDITGYKTNSTYGFNVANRKDIKHIKECFGFQKLSKEGELSFINETYENFKKNKHCNKNNIKEINNVYLFSKNKKLDTTYA